MSTPTHLVYAYAAAPEIRVANVPLPVIAGCAEIATVGELCLTVVLAKKGQDSPEAFIVDTEHWDGLLFASNDLAVREFLQHLTKVFCESRTPGRQAFLELTQIADRIAIALHAAGVEATLLNQLSIVLKGLL